MIEKSNVVEILNKVFTHMGHNNFNDFNSNTYDKLN